MRLIEKCASLLDTVARHKLLCCLGVGMFIIGLRASLLPVWPIPVPSIYDEFSYLLQADTFAHGRLANPPHPLWQFFESIYILQQPTYASRYPPGQALAMAGGQILFGHPWFGVLLSCGVLAAALCWSFMGWMPGRWALAGSALSVQLCFFSYWANSYWGGAVTALGGALVTGALGRLRQNWSAAQGFVLGGSVAVLMLTRPFEGLLLVCPVLIFLALRAKRRRGWLPAFLCFACCVAAGAAFLALCNYRVTGIAWRLPYQEYFRQYETVPPFSVAPLRPMNSVTFRHFDLEWLDRGWALDAWKASRTWRFPLMRMRDWYQALSTVLGSELWIIPLLGFIPRLMRMKDTRFLLFLALVTVAGSFMSVGFFPHYAAPFAAVLFILAIQSIRQLRSLAPVGLCLVLGYQFASDTAKIVRRQTPDRFRSANSARARMERDLIDKTGGRHVILVRYTMAKNPHEEWIYNGADIDGAPVIWAQDMGEPENGKLIRYFAGRHCWLFSPDVSTESLAPCPAH